MTLRPLISLSLLLFAWSKAGAQLAPADDFFHGGAQLYISNNIPQAKEVVGQGRKLYPEDEKLKKLEALLNQQQQQNQQDKSQSQQSQDQKKSEQQKPEDQKKQDQKNSQDQQKSDEQKKNEAEQKKDEEQKKAEQEKKPADQPKDDSQEKKDGQPVKPGEMTPEEAKRLLDAQKGNEQLLQLKPDAKPRNNQRPVRDW